ncbi:Uncharacterized protein TCM_045184 [Theobroma cacao]|uniref:Uncharacterized protein n=1 Tax=Theobroma cacao TaxID=3641 RepID=A0A061FRX2_THECC|nr:Uncharacterized protein TCM_045184 [Theobroma cacao]
MKERKGLAEHTNNFNEIIKMLRKLGVEIGEEQITLMFLASLHDSYADAEKSVICAQKKLTLANAQEAARLTRKSKQVSNKLLKPSGSIVSPAG